LYYIPYLTNLECHSSVCLTAIQPLTSRIKVQLKGVIVIAFENRIFHDLSHHILQLTSPKVEILIFVFWSLPHVKALDSTIEYSLVHSLVQIRVNILGIKIRTTNQGYQLFWLFSCPLVLQSMLVQEACSRVHEGAVGAREPPPAWTGKGSA
jgi:hypothetical protein